MHYERTAVKLRHAAPRACNKGELSLGSADWSLLKGFYGQIGRRAALIGGSITPNSTTGSRNRISSAAAVRDRGGRVQKLDETTGQGAVSSSISGLAFRCEVVIGWHLWDQQEGRSTGDRVRCRRDRSRLDNGKSAATVRTELELSLTLLLWS